MLSHGNKGPSVSVIPSWGSVTGNPLPIMHQSQQPCSGQGPYRGPILIGQKILPVFKLLVGHQYNYNQSVDLYVETDIS